MNEHRCVPATAGKLWNWLLTRGGLYIWPSVDLSDPGQTWTTPAETDEGKPYERPIWKADGKPSRHITDRAEVLVDVPQEVRRFRVGVRRGDQGLVFKVTDGGSRKIRQMVAKANRDHQTEEAWYSFDYDTQEAVIFVPGRSLPIQDYILETLGDFP